MCCNQLFSFFFAVLVLSFLLLILVLVHPGERLVLLLQGIMTLEPLVLLIVVFLLHLLLFLRLKSKLEVHIVVNIQFLITNRETIRKNTFSQRMLRSLRLNFFFRNINILRVEILLPNFLTFTSTLTLLTFLFLICLQPFRLILRNPYRMLSL